MRRLWPVVAALSRGRVIYKDRSGRRRLFLTFDDGPHPDVTPKLLDLLERHGVKATFFMVGREMCRSPEIVAAVLARGHEIGNHSMTHRRFSWATSRAKLREIDEVDRLLESHGAPRTGAFRLPFAEDSVRLLIGSVLAGRRVALWSRDSLDYRLDGEEVARRLEARPVEPGDVLLFHDDGPSALVALEALLPRWRAEGYSFGVLSEIR